MTSAASPEPGTPTHLPPAGARLDVLATFNQAWQRVFKARVALLRALVVPSILLVCIAHVDIPSDGWLALGGRGLRWLMSMLVWAMYAVSCHRILLATPSPSGVFGLSLSRPVLHYFGYTIMLLLSAVLALVGAGLAAGSVFGLPEQAPPEVIRLFGHATLAIQATTLLLVMYVNARFVLILPAKALGADAILEDAWRWSSGNGWRLLLTIMMVTFSALLALLPLIWGLGRIEHAAVSVVLAVITNLASAVAVAAISCSYRALVPMR